MASYVFKCASDHTQTIESSIHETVVAPVCQCGLDMKRVFTAPPITFKGNGWGHQ